VVKTINEMFLIGVDYTSWKVENERESLKLSNEFAFSLMTYRIPSKSCISIATRPHLYFCWLWKQTLDFHNLS